MKTKKEKNQISSDNQIKSNTSIPANIKTGTTLAKNLPIYWAIIIFAVTTLVFFNGHLFGDFYFWEDFAEYILPTQSFAASQFADGTIPFWNPYSLGGMPFFADIQVGFFYPINRLLTLFVGDNGMIPVGVLQFVIILHFFIAQINYFIFARYLKISFWGAVFSAIAYSFAFPILLHIIHPMIVYHFTWFPLIFFFFKKGLDEQNIKLTTIAGLILGFTMLSGHPQVTLYFGMILGLYLVWDVVASIMKEKVFNKIVTSKITFGLLALFLAVGIYSIQLFPSNELAKHSVRSVTNYEKSAENSLQLKQVLTLAFPKLFGYYNADNETKYPTNYTDTYDGKEQQVKNYYYWETAIYFGIIPLILALFGLFVVPKDSFKWFLIFIIAFGLFYSFGKYFVLHQAFYNLPFFGVFRNPVRMFTFSMFGLTLFSGFFFDYIFQQINNRKVLNYTFVFFGAFFLLVIFAITGSLQSFLGIEKQFVEYSINSTSVLLIVIFTFTSIYLAIKGKISSTILGIILTILIFADIYIEGSDFTKSKINPAQKYEINADMQKFLTPQSHQDFYRVKTRIYSPSYMAAQRNQGLISEIYMLEGYNPLVLKLASIPFPWEGTFQLLNVKYDIKIDSTQGMPVFYENTNRLGAAWLVTKAKYHDTVNARGYFYENPIDISKEVVLHSNIPTINKYNSIDSNFIQKVVCTNYSPSKIEYKTSSNKDAMMVFAEIYYPDWVATIDGKETEIYQANYSVRAIELPKGEHKIVMEYRSKGFQAGAYGFMISIILSIIFLVLSNKINSIFNKN